jgi:hypothetical protein
MYMSALEHVDCLLKICTGTLETVSYKTPLDADATDYTEIHG